MYFVLPPIEEYMGYDRETSVRDKRKFGIDLSDAVSACVMNAAYRNEDDNEGAHDYLNTMAEPVYWTSDMGSDNYRAEREFLDLYIDNLVVQAQEFISEYIDYMHQKCGGCLVTELDDLPDGSLLVVME